MRGVAYVILELEIFVLSNHSPRRKQLMLPLIFGGVSPVQTGGTVTVTGKAAAKPPRPLRFGRERAAKV